MLPFFVAPELYRAYQDHVLHGAMEFNGRATMDSDVTRR